MIDLAANDPDGDALTYELDELKSEKAIKEAGKMRSEGKSYVLQDGDVVHYLFNV